MIRPLAILIRIKIVPLLNSFPRHEDVWVSGGITLRILKLGTRWLMINFTLRPLYPRGTPSPPVPIGLETG